MSAPTAIVHDAVLYDDDTAVSDRIAEQTERSLSLGGHVLVCVPERLHERLTDTIGTDRRHVEIRAISRRYGRPIDAMEQLWTFARRHIADGATHAVSIGELPVVDEADLDAWLWYEAAVSEVLRELPIHATCLLDRRALGEERLDRMYAMHSPHCTVPHMPLVSMPDAPPTLTCRTRAPAEGRALVGGLRDVYGQDLVARAVLVVSELVSNTVQHAASDAVVRLWTDPETLYLSVTDDGPGVTDPVAPLRPPNMPVRGAGLWLCHQVADRFSVHARADGGCEARAHFDVASML